MMKWFLIYLVALLPVFAESEKKERIYKCSTLSRMIEIEEGLPPLLLSAITFIESSDMPWVIGVEGQSHRFNTKKGALEKIKELKARRHKNFDIGCMQINHHYHKDKFQSEEDMLNPIHNIRFAARFLKQLKEESGSWEKAVSHYNSRDLRYSAPYANKVYQHWGKIKSMGNLPLELANFANVPKAKLDVKLNAQPILPNSPLERAKIAYLTYKKTLVRK
jgi:hypothetical protein